MRYIVVFTALVLTVAPASAEERVRGLLSLPEVFGSGACATFTPEDVALHASPNDGKPFGFIHVEIGRAHV